MIWLGVVVYILMILIVLWWFTRTHEESEKSYQAETAAEGRKEALVGYADSDDSPHLYVHCDYNPDEVKTFYEVPDTLAELIQPSWSRQTFAECLAGLVDPHKKENE